MDDLNVPINPIIHSVFDIGRKINITTTKITISSNINDLDLVHFYKGMEFYEEGYDIYNISQWRG